MSTKRSLRFFNTTGPCDPDYHYMLPPEDRLVGAQLHRYIKDRLYWVLHAPRQTGKTTFLLNKMREINAGGEAIACYVSVGCCDVISDTNQTISAICDAIKWHASSYNVPVPKIANKSIYNLLGSWAKLVAPKPLIVFFDELEVLTDESLMSFLSQLSKGFVSRDAGIFPVSIALLGRSDMKGNSGPYPDLSFVTVDSAMFMRFQKNDIANLFAQRTTENGQLITQEALDYVYEQSQGQPWIVNSLFKRATMCILNQESVETITVSHIQKAMELMFRASDTHLEGLSVRLRNPQIREIIDTMITCEPAPALAESDTFRYLSNLGFVTVENGTPIIANPIYRKVIADNLACGIKYAIPKPEWQWEMPDGSLNMDDTLKEFQLFWRRYADRWEQKLNYPRAFSHLMLLGFMQRVLYDKGHIEYEFSAGRGRMDLGIEYNGQWYIIEIKLVHHHDGPQTVREEGLEQIRKYRDKIARDAPAYLLIFDRRPKTKEKSWDERISWEQDDDVTVLGC